MAGCPVITLIGKDKSHEPCETFFFFLVFCLLRAAPVAYGDSQARVLVGAVAASLHQSHSQRQIHQIRCASATYTTAHGNAGSLTH